ncbi:MAG: hypothetical protein HUU23_00270 [Caldilineales bacterium]|nr:hypothetical protein [Caldilineales bacterium]
MNPTSQSCSDPIPTAIACPEQRRRWIEPAIVQERSLATLIQGDEPPPMGPPFGPLGPMGLMGPLGASSTP